MNGESAFSRLYARLLLYLDPDPVRSEQTLRAIQRAIFDSGRESRKKSSRP